MTSTESKTARDEASFGHLNSKATASIHLLNSKAPTNQGSEIVEEDGPVIVGSPPPSHSLHNAFTNGKEPGNISQAYGQRHVGMLDGVSMLKSQAGLLAPDETGTTISSTDGQPASMDSKSVTSTTTFALDEKESLRPDDSASIKAAVEDDVLPVQDIDLRPDVSHEEVYQAFQEQLDEIQAVEPVRRPLAAVDDSSVAYSSSAIIAPVPTLPTNLTAEPADISLDSKLLDALNNPRDRIWVLKLEQDVIDFVKDGNETSLHLPQCNSFYRMLAHKIADYYTLGHAVDESNSAVRLFKLGNNPIPRPLTGITAPSTAASTPPPSSMQMKILRRGINSGGPAIANGSSLPSKSTSENGESGGDEEKRPATREEREARYEAARLRIMGSAKPNESIEMQKTDSRSSSANGKRSRKKRTDSDDDFEARSAYNSFPANAQTSQFPHPSFYPPQPQMTGGYGQQAGNFGQQTAGWAGQQQQQMSGWSGQSQQNNGWSGQQQAGPGGYQPMPAFPQYAQPYYYPPDPAQNWSQASSPAIDLSQSFDRLSLQQSGASSPTGAPYMSNYQQFPASQTWTNSYMSSPPPGPYSDRPSSSASQSSQPYAYGQLPSQALGRPPNALEHPLPGSYKSRHFNPQSQAFVPGHARPLPQRTTSGPANASPSSQFQALNSRMPLTSLTHPLPQPVFATQTMPNNSMQPNASLPPKPSMPPSTISDRQPSLATSSNESISKWGTSASLPAKPPPRIEEQADPSVKYLPEHPSTAMTMPVFGSMPAGAHNRDG